MLATLVVFRVLYFLIPFGIAISIMGTRELWLNVVVPWQQRRRLSETYTGLHRSAAAGEKPAHAASLQRARACHTAEDLPQG